MKYAATDGQPLIGISKPIEQMVCSIPKRGFESLAPHDVFRATAYMRLPFCLANFLLSPVNGSVNSFMILKLLLQTGKYFLNFYNRGRLPEKRASNIQHALPSSGALTPKCAGRTSTFLTEKIWELISSSRSFRYFGGR